MIRNNNPAWRRKKSVARMSPPIMFFSEVRFFARLDDEAVDGLVEEFF